MRPPTLALTAAFLLLTPALAAGQTTGTAPPTAALAARAPAAPAGASLDSGRTADPNIDRGLLYPTAETQAAGSVTVTSYELIILGATVGITDRIQVSAIALLPELEEWGPEKAWAGTVKWQALRTPLLRLSVMAGMGYEEDGTPRWELPPDRRDSDKRKHIYSPLAGVVGSVCASQECHSMLSINAHLRGVVGDEGWRRSELLLSASFVGRLTERSKLALEYGQAVKVAPAVDRRDPSLAVGVRVHRSSLAFDAGLVGILATTAGVSPCRTSP